MNDGAIGSMEAHEILKLLPHRFPMALVDRVLECRARESIRAIKNVTLNEPFFVGHFPGRPVMPGVLILEALAQTAGILVFKSIDVIPDDTTRFFFVGIDGARFRKPVFPGDQLMLHAEFQRSMRGIWKFGTRAEVNGAVVCSAEMMVTPEAKG